MDTVGGVETWFERRSLDDMVNDFEAGVRPLIYNRQKWAVYCLQSTSNAKHIPCNYHLIIKQRGDIDCGCSTDQSTPSPLMRPCFHFKALGSRTSSYPVKTRI
jgi:hypothetical protein